MLDGPGAVHALKQYGVSHVVWIPDSALGTWEPALMAEPDLRLIRACREGEALAIAGGLILGGKQPVVVIQCTGLFEAGDALRNLVHDLRLPLFLIVGVRGYQTYRRGATNDTCPAFIEPVLQAWQIPYRWLSDEHPAAELSAGYQQARQERRAAVALLAE